MHFLNGKHLADTKRRMQTYALNYISSITNTQTERETDRETFITLQNIQNSSPEVTDKGTFPAEKMSGICFVFSSK